MSLTMIIAVNVAAAATLSLILAILMLAPKRLRPHHHPRHREHNGIAPIARRRPSHPGAPRQPHPTGPPRVVADALGD